MLDEVGVSQYQDSPQSGSGSDSVTSSLGAQFTSGNQSGERTGLVLDNLTLQKWLVVFFVLFLCLRILR